VVFKWLLSPRVEKESTKRNMCKRPGAYTYGRSVGLGHRPALAG
jgi:hypothetical protein